MGFFITFEGIDGAGKSTQARMLAGRLRSAVPVVLTREPGGAPGAEAIRTLLVEGEPGRWSPETELLLFNAARRDHVERVIRPALEAGQVVLCDRYVDSTRAYQGGSGLRDRADRVHDLMIGLDPDLTLIFDVDPGTGAARAGARGGAEDRFERKGLAFQEALRREFRAIAEAEPRRCALIDADGSQEAVAERVWSIVRERLPQDVLPERGHG
ncbi:MAG: dTMP kinase [Pseudomonadota bacterium]